MSGRTALQVGGAVVGGVIGFFAGGPVGAFQGAALGAGIGGIAGAIIYQPDPIHQHGPKLLDVRPTTSQYGSPINYVWGTMRLAGEVIWQTDLQEVANTQTIESGKGGGDSSATTYSYWAAFAVRVARVSSPALGIRKIWADGALVYDRSFDAGGATFGTSYTEYIGGASQLPDPTMEQWLGAGNVPGHHKDVYQVYPQLFLDIFGRRIPNLNYELCTVGTGYDAASDSFDRADEYPLAGNWVSFSGGDAPNQYRISGNKVAWESSGGETGARWLYPATLAHFQQITLSGTVSNGSQLRLYNRVSLSSGSINDGILGIIVFYSLTEDYLIQSYGGTTYYSFSTVGGDSNLVRNLIEQNGSVLIRFDSNGTTHTITMNGVVIAQATTSNQNTSSHQYQGFELLSNSYTIDNWSGGGIGLGGTIAPLLPTQVALSTIVSDLCVMAGLTTGQIDVTALSGDLVDGFHFRGPAPARQAIEQLMRVYRFDAVESAGKIKFVKRGGSSARTLTVADIGYAPSPEGSAPIRIERVETLGLPKQIEVGYFSAAADYQVVTQYSRRLSGGATDNQRIDFPIVMTDTQGKDLADLVLHSSWENREFASTDAWHRHLDIEPTDVITIDDGSSTTTMRVTRTDFGADGLVKLLGVVEDSASYTPSTQTTTIGGGGNAGQTVTLPQLSDAVIFEAPMLLVDRNAPELWVAGYSLTGQYTQVEVQRSTDGGANYTTVLTVPTSTAVGTAVTVLATADPYQIDTQNSVEVYVGTQYTLASVSVATMREGANVAMIGNEVIAFATATLVSSGRWRLSKLIRGLRGTEWAVGLHEVNERFILLTTALRRIELTTPNINQPILLRYAPQGATSWTDATMTLTGRNMEPLTVASIASGRGVGGDIQITWVRRSRLAEGWTSAEVPMDESGESYELEIWNDARTVRYRNITGLTTPLYTYTGTDQTSDFGSLKTAVEITIYAISSSVGRGYPATATV